MGAVDGLSFAFFTIAVGLYLWVTYTGQRVQIGFNSEVIKTENELVKGFSEHSKAIKAMSELIMMVESRRSSMFDEMQVIAKSLDERIKRLEQGK